MLKLHQIPWTDIASLLITSHDNTVYWFSVTSFIYLY